MKKKIFWSSILILLLINFSVKIPVFEMNSNDQTFYYKIIQEPIIVILEHEHSVSKNRIIESYEISENHIVLKEMVFKDHGGAGMPDVSKDKVYLDDFGIHYLMSEDFKDEIVFMIYPMHLWKLSVSNHVYDFSTQEKNSEIMMSVTSETIFKYLFKTLIY
ncbi:MAG: DUF1850 domain-containing protein [Clostridia bacterium]|nr:DUF1850 domain-containing protein [Clostridia bacterium]